MCIVGSQAILATVEEGPRELFLSREADLFIDGRPDLSDLVDGSIGELSPFDETFGYYAHGVSVETAVMPEGWRSRLIRLENENTGGTAGLCAEIHDVAASKVLAGREKDIVFVKALVSGDLVDCDTVQQRIEMLPVDGAERERAANRFRRISG